MRLLRSLLPVLAAACAGEPRTNVPAPRAKPGNLIDFNTLAEREGERFMKDERHVSACMRARGYSDAAQ